LELEMRDPKMIVRARRAGVLARPLVASVIVALVVVGTGFAASQVTAFSGPRARRHASAPPPSPLIRRDSQTASADTIQLSAAQRSAITALNDAYKKKFAALVTRAVDAGPRLVHAPSSGVAGASSTPVASQITSGDSALLAAANALQAEYNGKYRALLTSDQRGVLDRATAYALAHAASMIPPKAPEGVQ
jgi:hypothetical protein